MARDDDRIDDRIACLHTDRMAATLIATRGYHCEVWRAAGSRIRAGARVPMDVVIKVHREPCTRPEVMSLQREYRRLRGALGELVPDTAFIATRINGAESVIAIAPTVSRWFDVANPANESEALPLFRRLRRARHQLARFIEVAEGWDREDRVIDLYGLENLVLDSNRSLRYIDSFRVFFYADLLHAIDCPDEGLRERIDKSRQRLDYLRFLLAESG